VQARQTLALTRRHLPVTRAIRSKRRYIHGLLLVWARWRYYTLRMNTELIWQTVTTSSDDTSKLGELLGSNLSGGELLELSSDLGGGKTTFTQGLARGLGSNDPVSSPTFTLSRIYKAKNGLQIHHFDFYRLDEPGVLRDQLTESLNDKYVVAVIEWSGIVKDVLPVERISIEFKPTAADPDERQITFSYAETYVPIIEKVRTAWTSLQP
jgi:tRNA threonylcarbamoyladenosine biosynthesis protein TsaE